MDDTIILKFHERYADSRDPKEMPSSQNLEGMRKSSGTRLNQSGSLPQHFSDSSHSPPVYEIEEAHDMLWSRVSSSGLLVLEEVVSVPDICNALPCLFFIWGVL